MSDGTNVQSVRARLLALAKIRGDDFNVILSRYAIERFLYRLSVSPLSREYCLKGAQLFHLWFDDPHRPTRDADLLGLGSSDERTVAESMSLVASVETGDGMVFDPDSVTVDAIREETRYGGLRVRVAASLGSAGFPIQIDIGFGDAVVPQPKEERYPTLLPDMPEPRLLVYPRAAVMSEKLEAIVHLGMANSRMKDYYDLFTLCQEGRVDTQSLARAIVATFDRRGTALPEMTPLGLTDEFAGNADKQAQWKGFVNRNVLSAPPLGEIVEQIRRCAADALQRARATRD